MVIMLFPSSKTYTFMLYMIFSPNINILDQAITYSDLDTDLNILFKFGYRSKEKHGDTNRRKPLLDLQIARFIKYAPCVKCRKTEP